MPGASHVVEDSLGRADRYDSPNCRNTAAPIAVSDNSETLVGVRHGFHCAARPMNIVGGAMASAAEVNKLRGRVANIVCSVHCNYHIRFQLANIRIQTLQFAYVGGLVKRGKVNVRIGSGNGYDHTSNTITFDDVDVGDHAIVHEAAHAVIDATHPGVTITKGTGEAAAYLSEMIYSLVTTGEAVDLDVPRLTRPVWLLARSVLAHNRANKDSYRCPSSDVANIVGVLQSSRLVGDVFKAYTMDDIPYR
jgi:hypothetical protein